MIDTGLKNKVVLVTGANHGIGTATAKAFAAQGAKVFIQYLRFAETADQVDKITTPGNALYRANQNKSTDEVVKAIRDQGGIVESWEVDLAQPANIPELFNHVENVFGTVDVLVNNAAFGQPDTFLPQEQRKAEDRSPSGFAIETITPELHDKHFAVNSRAVSLLMAEYAKRHIKHNKQWGRIISVSTDGAMCFPGEISYGASKYALESYNRSASRELGKYGITVNIVSPGPIQTGWISPEMEEETKKKSPLGRIGQPEDVADVIVFLASEQARWLTGQLLYVGGGHAI